MPSQHDNPPNLTTLAYRLGTHPTFLRRMLARLPNQTVPPGALETTTRPLDGLTTRDSDDPVIALLDAWAVVADVLTFYQERIANEGYLRTGTERRSIVELARAIGYELRPGLAASASVAFTVEATPSTPGPITLAAGLKIQSIPGQDELPQTFETMETIEARPEWNTLQPYLPLISAPQTIDSETTELYLAGVGTALQPGQQLLVMSDMTGRWSGPTLQTVEPEPTRGYTRVTWGQGLPETDQGALPAGVTSPQVFAFRQQAALFGHNASRWEDVPSEMKEVQGGVQRLTGDAWESIQAGLPYRAILALAARRWGNVDYLLAGTAGEGVYRSADNGESWTSCNTNLTNLMVHSLFVDAQGDLFAGSTDGAIFRSMDNGESWTLLSTGSLVETVETSDGSETVSVVSNGLPSTTIYALAGYEEEVVSYLYAGTDSGIYQSSDDGVTWTQLFDRKGVRALLVTPDDLLFVGSRDGLFQADLAAGSPSLAQVSPTDLNDRVIQALALETDQNGTLIILAGTDDGILTAASTAPDAEWTLLAESEEQDVRALAVGQDGTRFAATPLAGFVHDDWPGFQIDAAASQIDLNGVYARILTDSWVVLVNSEQIAPYRVRQASTVLRRDFGQEAKITRLELEIGPDAPSLDTFGGARLRETEVLIQSEVLPLFEVARPLDDPVEGNQIELDRVIPPLEPGRRIIVSGHPTSSNEPDETIVEVGFVSGVNEHEGRSIILLREPLQHRYDRATVIIQANVVLATQGETVTDEVLGSGDGTQTNQRFRLKKPPLTYVPAPTMTGARSTVEVRVNGVLWSEVDSLHTLDDRSQSYIIRQNDQGQTSLIFGDGQQGARLPTGAENVVATYRSGLGLAGEVPANSLVLLQTRPLGVVEVTNPLPAGGAADPETPAEARKNAPRTVLTMDRIVSLSDFEDFAQSFTGIGQAQATLLWTGETRLMHITLAGSDGDEIDSDSALYKSLVEAIDRRRNRLQQVQLDSYEPLLFNLAARVFIDPRYEAETVESALKQALVDTFSFQNRVFGQAVTASEVIAVIQGVPGVVAVDLDSLYLTTHSEPELNPLLSAEKAHWSQGEAKPAQLLLLNQDEDGVELDMMSLK